MAWMVARSRIEATPERTIHCLGRDKLACAGDPRRCPERRLEKAASCLKHCLHVFGQCDATSDLNARLNWHSERWARFAIAEIEKSAVTLSGIPARTSRMGWSFADGADSGAENCACPAERCSYTTTRHATGAAPLRS